MVDSFGESHGREQANCRPPARVPGAVEIVMLGCRCRCGHEWITARPGASARLPEVQVAELGPAEVVRTWGERLTNRSADMTPTAAERLDRIRIKTEWAKSTSVTWKDGLHGSTTPTLTKSVPRRMRTCPTKSCGSNWCGRFRMSLPVSSAMPYTTSALLSTTSFGQLVDGPIRPCPRTSDICFPSVKHWPSTNRRDRADE